MATIKQRKAVEKVVENGGSVSRAMRDAGYSAETAKTPKKLTESKGWHELMEEAGLTDELIVNALVEDIKSNKGKRVPELTLAGRFKGKLTDKVEVEHSGPAGIFGDNKLIIEVVDGHQADAEQKAA